MKLTSANLNSLNQRSAGEAAQPAPAAQGLNNPYEDEDDEDDEGMVHPHAKLPPHRRGNFFAEAGAAAKGVAGRSTASQSVTGSSLGGVKENKSASSAAFRAPPSLSSAENWATVRGAASNARAAPSSGTAGPAIGYTGYTPAGMPVQMHRAPSTTAGSNFGDTKVRAPFTLSIYHFWLSDDSLLLWGLCANFGVDQRAAARSGVTFPQSTTQPVRRTEAQDARA